MRDKSCFNCKHHDLIVLPFGITPKCELNCVLYKRIGDVVVYEELDLAMKICARLCDRYVSK